MEQSHRHQVAVGIGVGVTVIFYFLPTIVPTMPKSIAWAGLFFGVFIFAWGLWPLAKHLLSGKHDWFGNGLMPLHEAARIAFEKTQNSAYAQMAAGYQESPSVILRTYAKFLLTNNKRQTYGKLLPSDTVTVVDIDPSELTEDCRSTKPRDRDITHTGLAIRRRDLNQAIKIINRSDDILG